MRVADYIFKFLAEYGVEHVFMVSGGGAMFLNDALGRQRSIKYICNHHEQASAIAAEGYARIHNRLGVVCVTTGPGGTNALTGIVGSWLDSMPMLVISGQVKRELLASRHVGLRQLGDQELNIIDIVKPVTKYAKMVTSPLAVKQELAKAVELAVSGRPGPVWLDIPLDVQQAEIEESELYNCEMEIKNDLPEVSDRQIALIIDLLKEAEAPAMICGSGVASAHARDALLKLASNLNIPVMTAVSGADLINSDHELFAGRPGVIGERAANTILQNCDLLLSIGTRMNLRIVGFNYQTTARQAFKIYVDTDWQECGKISFRPDLAVHSDAGIFIEKLQKALEKPLEKKREWLAYCQKLKRKYPLVLNKHRTVKENISSYYFIEVLSKNLTGNETIVTGNGTAYTTTFQALKLRAGNRLFGNVGCASMGYGLPAAIGAAFAESADRDIICLTGDGSIQMNLQELQTIVNYQLPVKIFIFDNSGYLSISNTQKNFFNGNFVGSRNESGVICPDMAKIAAAYGLKSFTLKNHNELDNNIEDILNSPGPAVIVLKMSIDEQLEPKAAAKMTADNKLVSTAIDDLAPFLSEDELNENKFKY